MNIWIAVLAVGAGSYALRAAPLFSPRCRTLSADATARLERAGLASLLALAAASMRHQVVGVSSSAAAASVAALLVGGVLALRGKPMHVVALVGLAAHLVVSTTISQVG